jgi:hypothetical protein
MDFHNLQSIIRSISNISNGVLTVYNVLGEKLFTTLFNGHQQIINCSLEKGIYFIQLNVDNHIWIEKALKY